MTKEIFIITKNIGKIAAANKAFSKFGVEVKNIDKDYPEIQASSSLEIAKFTAIQAAKELGLPVLREDHSLFITALGGFPGPYTSYFDKKIPAEKILELKNNPDLCNKIADGGYEIFKNNATPEVVGKDLLRNLIKLLRL